MGWYSEFIFPRLCDRAARHRALDARRGAVLRAAQGRCLEVGIGTGINLEHYPEHIRELSAIDPSPGMRRAFLSRYRDHRIKVEYVLAGAERMPFADESFDTVVSTLTFCTIPDLDQALTEIRRVLKPRGRLLLLEHGLSPERRVSRWQRALNPLQGVLCCGCSLTVDVRAHLARAGFAAERVGAEYADGVPKFIGYLYAGEVLKM